MSMNCEMNAPKNTSTLGLRAPQTAEKSAARGAARIGVDAFDRAADQPDAEPAQTGGAGKRTQSNVPMVAISDVPDRDDADHGARPAWTPAILVSAALVPCRRPLAITSVTTGSGSSASAMQRRQRRDRPGGHRGPRDGQNKLFDYAANIEGRSRPVGSAPRHRAQPC
jgi:hypothetical protein